MEYTIETRDINELRVRIDQLNEKIISNLKTRSNYPVNIKVFEEEFSDGLSWFKYRLKKEQDLDSEFGRFMYYDQQPFIFKKNDLEESKINEPEHKGTKPIDIDLSEKIIKLYKNTIENICESKEDVRCFGETTKQDVENILTLNERTAGIGEQVAAFKTNENPELKNISDFEELRNKLRNVKREEEVINSMINIARKYEIENISSIEKFAKELIEITLDAEVHFIINSK
jgi:chorismate mutase